MHPLLARQLKKFFNTEDISAWPQQWKKFSGFCCKNLPALRRGLQAY